MSEAPDTAATSANPSFLERRPLRRWLRKVLRNWRERHRHPFNFAIHLLGIPLALFGVLLFIVLPWSLWYWGVGAFVLGYLLQYIGHKVEGNDVGEWAGIKRMLGLPYVAISPRWETDKK
jgi:predicted membrane channel-forming protein YqfA (hemolysin III family)